MIKNIQKTQIYKTEHGSFRIDSKKYFIIIQKAFKQFLFTIVDWSFQKFIIFTQMIHSKNVVCFQKRMNYQ